MFEELIQKFDVALKKLRGMGKLTEKNVADSMRDIRKVLLEADVHYKVAKDFIQRVQEKAVGEEVIKSISPGQQVVKIVRDELVHLLGDANAPLRLDNAIPSIIMVVGLQGSGKTTFVSKLAGFLRKKGHQPLMVAADVYRPAAINQLETLGEASNIPVFSMGTEKPLTIVKKAIDHARKNSLDTLILDTAGRLHIDEEMMMELKDIRQSVKPSEILFVADSMTGQDAVRSAEVFLKELDFTGTVLTKMDGDSKGGAALSIRAVTEKPIKFLSTGEKMESLEAFHPDRMASRILGMGDVVTLVEKAQETMDEAKAEKLAKKLKKQTFTFEDFFDQLQQLKKMGPLEQVAGMLPGMGHQMGKMQVDEKDLGKVEAIINSMTIEERQKPHIIKGSRRKRIAGGSGTTVQDVNRLLKQFHMMQKMMKQMSRWDSKRMPKGFSMGM